MQGGLWAGLLAGGVADLSLSLLPRFLTSHVAHYTVAPAKHHARCRLDSGAHLESTLGPSSRGAGLQVKPSRMAADKMGLVLSKKEVPPSTPDLLLKAIKS